MAPLVLPLRLSSTLIGALTVVHALPCIAVLGVGVPNYLKLIVIFLVVISIVVQYLRARRLAPMHIELLRESEVFLLDGEERHALELLTGSVDLGVLIVLHWREQASARIGRCALTRDGIGADAWRALRVWLRWHSGLQKQD